MVVKNTYGISAVIDPKILGAMPENEFAGSALDRKKYPKKEKDFIRELLKIPLKDNTGEQDGDAGNKNNTLKGRVMSPRTKSKIRKKLIAFAGVQKKLSFVTLTFCNVVEDRKAVRILAKFLENATKMLKDFQYLWVAEKQQENEVFTDNIHFHLITNKYWNIKRWWAYWLNLQASHGIKPREESFKPSSAFDVKQVSSHNIKGITNYFTKYITKNKSTFNCQVWNCSRKLSWLYTDFYSRFDFIRQLEALEKTGQLGGTIIKKKKEFCNVHVIPLNRVTMKFYEKIDDKNKTVWNSPLATLKESKDEKRGV